MASSHGVPRVAKEGDREKETELIRDYRALLETVNAKIQAREFTDGVLALTSKLLKKNPEYYTIWNHRRRILLHRFDGPPNPATTDDGVSQQQRITHETISSDLQFVVPLLMQYPKCYWIWNYRQWLLEEAERRLAKEEAGALWTAELGLVGKMLARDERNFHGWGYRRFVVGRLDALRPTEQEGTMVASEFAYTDKMIKAKLHNFSALHYKSKLLPVLLQEQYADGSARRAMLRNELNLMQDALIDPFNQSAWFYHQFLMSSMGEELPVQQRLVSDLTTDEKIEIYEQELERIKEITEDFDDCKWAYEALITYSMDYAKLDGSAAPDRDALYEWLQQLRRLDPMRNGRWAELAVLLDLF